MGKPVLFVAALVFVLAAFVWGQVIDSQLPNSPLGLAVDDVTVVEQSDEQPDGEVRWY